MNFIFELERLKVVYRQNGILGESRHENSAEHSWHIAVMAFVLREYCGEPVDIERVLKMLLIHDVVEIHAGDTFLYDQEKRDAVKEAEAEAAEKIFGMLPDDQKGDFLAAWREFEAGETAEARYAAVLDNLQPMLNHCFTDNLSIAGKGLTRSRVMEKKKFIGDFSGELWEYALKVLDESVKKGQYREG